MPSAQPRRCGGKVRVQQAEGEWHDDSRADALSRACGDERPDRRRERTRGRGEREHRESDGEHPPPTETVAEGGAGHQQDGEAQRVGVDRPFEIRHGGVQIALDRGERGGDDQHVEDDHEGADGGQAEYPPLCVAVVLTLARAGDGAAFQRLVEPYRRELQVHCYRILGSVQDAEDLLQETLLAAWRGIDGYEGRASVRTWLYRIATNRCLNALRAGARPWPTNRRSRCPRRPEPSWLEPYPDTLLVLDDAPGPEARYEARESVSLAFLAALQQLPAAATCRADTARRVGVQSRGGGGCPRHHRERGDQRAETSASNTFPGAARPGS
jgi:RNA polymerase sigma factor (sigma-70 family)